MSGFDVVAHHRERTRKAEQRADSLERQRAQLDRLLAMALRVATRDGRDADPLALLAVLEDVDRAMQNPGPSIDELVQLLRETDHSRRPSKPTPHLRLVSGNGEAA